MRILNKPTSSFRKAILTSLSGRKTACPGISPNGENNKAFFIFIMTKSILKITLCMTLALFIGNTKAQNALDFDGTDDQISCGTDTSLNIKGKTFTIEAWIYPTAWKTNAYEGNVINKEYNTSNYGYMLRVGAGGKLNFAFGDGSWHEITTANTILSLNTWQHIAGTYDGNKMRAYLNGVAVDSLAYTGTMNNYLTQPLEIGFHSTYAGRFYQGMIDEVRIWSITRTQSQIYAGMTDEICAKTKGLRAYYKFNQGKAGGNNPTVKSLIDYSGYNNNGTLSAFALSGSGSNWLKGQSLKKAVTNAKDTEVRCDRFYSPSGKYKWFTSGVYKDTIPTAFGCDSAITFYVTIKKSTAKTIVAYACTSYKSPSGVFTWTQSGTYTDYLINAAKCDSAVTVILHIGGSSDSINPVVCKKYTVPSGKKTYTSSGLYTDTIKNFRGCDSVITINLTVLGPTYDTIYPKVCKSFKSPSGKYTYTKNGIYHDTIPNSLGCDSLITISVFINTSSSNLKKTVCNKYTSPSGKHIWTNTGNYKDTIPNYAGCDSVISINLTVNKTTFNSIKVSACRFYKSPKKKYIWKKTGIYKDTLVNSKGCDSIITIDLYIHRANAAVVQTGHILTATSLTGAYQWLNCSNAMSPVSGETNRVFTATIDADYALRITDSGCTDTSACFTVNDVSTAGLNHQAAFGIFPNPNSGSFELQLPIECTNARMRITDISGKLIYEQSFEHLKHSSIQISLTSGLYMVHIDSPEYNATQNLMIVR